MKKSEEDKTENTSYKEASEALKDAKLEVSEVKAGFRKWKKENKIRKKEAIENKKDLAAYEEWEKKLEAATAVREEAQAQVKALHKGKSGVGGIKYAYGTILDPKTGEERKITSKDPEGKRWRNHARKEAKKLNITPEQVEWDPNFFAKKVSKKEAKKAEKEAKKGEKAEKVDKSEKTEKGDASAKKTRRKRTPKESE